jgi:predicted nucleic acid-binding protein
MRVVLDTNILVSAMITSTGNPAEIVNAWLDGKFTLLTSAEHVDELRATLQKPRVANSSSPTRLGAWSTRSKSSPRTWARSRTCNAPPIPRMGKSEAGQADYLVTGDKSGLLARALIGVMTYTFARVNAVLQMRVRDYFVQGRRGWVRLHEKGGKEHDVPCHHKLEQYLDEYIAAAGLAGDPDGSLFRTTGRKTGRQQRMWQQDANRMILRRAVDAGIETSICNHTFRATGITAYLKNKDALETAQQIADHGSPRTTKLYDRRQDEISLDEVEKILI